MLWTFLPVFTRLYLPKSIACKISKKEAASAQSGPRDRNAPNTKEYAIQLLHHLKRLIDSKQWYDSEIEEGILEIEKYEHWKLFGYNTEDELLKNEIGISRDKIQECIDEAKSNPLKKQGERGNGRENKVYNINSFLGGDRASYLARRLMRDKPDIFAALESGKYKSVHAAALEAGIVKPMASVQRTREGFAKYIKRSFSESDIKWIKEQL